MKVALGQFAVSRDWQENRATCSALMQQAAAEHADLLVLPEAVLATDLNDPLWALQSAQPLDGPFVTALLAVSAEQTLTTLFCMHVPAEEGKAYNTLVAIAGGKIVAHYKKLHLYDAFTMRESNTIMAGETLPALLTVAGMNVGLMTCYDIRFPEMARWLALQGADVLVLPSAWVKGPLKEHHWETLVTARALENTCYMVATGECGMRNIGQSMVVDPLGTIIVRAAEAPALIYAELTAERLAHAREVLPVLKNRRFAAPVLSSH
ncbi:hydrolase [Enterobacterales bacterium CwR94]|nr:hydrolase [Enterobacterales bacterium CwR94]